MSLVFSKRSIAFPAAGWLLAVPLLGGCFLRAELPIQSPVPPTAAEDRKEKEQKTKLPAEAEALRELAGRVDAADDPRFTQAAMSPSAAVRIEVLRAWAASKRGPLPQIVVDLHYDDDPRVRVAALAMLAARKYPDALDYLARALHDVDLSVRLAAVRGLGDLDDPQARSLLAELRKDRAELVRAEAVVSIAKHGPETAVLAAAADPSWRVRLKVAAALAGYTDAAGSAAARRMLNDPSAEVQRQVVRSLASWPLDAAVPVLLDALARDAVSVRKLAADQLAARWPGDPLAGGGRFPVEAPPARRAEALAELRARYVRLSSLTGSNSQAGKPDVLATGISGQAGKPDVLAAADDQRVEQLVVAGDFAALAARGPQVVASLERLAVGRHMTLPEPVYRDVLPRHSSVFAALDRMARGKGRQRQEAAEELAALSRKQPLGELAAARLSALMAAESDAAVWLRALDAVRDEASEPAARMARVALTQNAGEVRRRACDYMAAHPDGVNEPFLVPCLADSDRNVVLAAIRALGAAGRMKNAAALEKQLASADEEIQLATAVALARLGDLAGDDAIRRLSYSGDFRIRGQLAQSLGDLGDRRFMPVLIRLLDDSKATVSHAALASLPRMAGRDAAQSADGTTVPTAEQMARWKKWWVDGGR